MALPGSRVLTHPVRLKHGMPLYIDFTNPSNTNWIEAGAVVDIGKRAHVAHVDIPPADSSKPDNPAHLAAMGGVYEGVADGALAVGAKVDFDLTSGKFTAAASGGIGFGYVEGPVGGAGADGDVIRVVHNPEPVS